MDVECVSVVVCIYSICPFCVCVLNVMILLFLQIMYCAASS